MVGGHLIDPLHQTQNAQDTWLGNSRYQDASRRTL